MPPCTSRRITSTWSGTLQKTSRTWRTLPSMKASTATALSRSSVAAVAAAAPRTPGKSSSRSPAVPKASASAACHQRRGDEFAGLRPAFLVDQGAHASAAPRGTWGCRARRGRPRYSVSMLNCTRSCAARPKTIAPSRPLPTGSASTHGPAGCVVPQRWRRASGAGDGAARPAGQNRCERGGPCRMEEASSAGRHRRNLMRPGRRSGRASTLRTRSARPARRTGPA